MVHKVKINMGGREPSRTSFIISKFVEFCKRTDLHGFKYIVMDDLNVVERSCWGVAVLLSINLAIYFVITAYKWYARNPIVTVIESTQGAIWDVPFPAVTICDLNIISRKAALEFANNLTLHGNITAEYIFKTIKLAPLLHSSISADEQNKKHLSILQDILDINGIPIETFFRELSPTSSCNNLVQRCMWKNTIYRCEQLFQQLFTMNSLCCTFNYYAMDISFNSKNLELLQTTSPRRVASCGYQTALTVLLHVNVDDYYSTMTTSRGILVYIDDAYNLPDFDSPVRMVNPSTEVLIALSPERTYSTPGIKDFTPEKRQCYYNDEIKIGEFHQYSFHNCMAWQKVEFARRLCDCVPFYFPIKENIRVCNFKDIECLEKLGGLKSPATCYGIYLNVDMKSVSSYKLSKEETDEFTCLPECEHFDYPLEVALGRLAKNTPLNGLPFFENVNLENRSVLNVFFNDLVSTRYRRDVYLNWQNILAAFGGLLSLMLGFTLISGFDFVLFFTFRVAYDLLQGSYKNGDTDAKSKRSGRKTYIINVEHRKSKKMYTEKGIEKWRTDNIRY